MNRTLPLRLALCAALCGCGRAAPTRVTTDTLPGGALRVMNAGPSEWTDTNGWKLVLERTVHPAGVADDWGYVKSLMLRPGGDIYVVDPGAPAIYHYGADGGLIASVARSGDGPGEIRQPQAAFLGDTLVIEDTGNWRVTLMDTAGHVIRSFAAPCCMAGPPISATASGSFWVATPLDDPTQLGRNRWVRVSSTGNRIDSLVEPRAVEPASWQVTMGGGRAQYTVPLAGQNRVVFLADGSVRYGATDATQYFTTRTGRDTTLIFGRSDLLATPAPAALRDSLFDRRVSRNAALAAVANKSDIPETLPIWLQFSVDDAGNTWIDRGGYGQPHLFDVYRPDGILRGTVAAPFAPGLMAWSGDHLAVVQQDDDGRSSVAIYRVVP
jgi:hypothetical protein